MAHPDFVIRAPNGREVQLKVHRCLWTLNAGTPRWRERLTRALAAGVDVVTSDTPRTLAAAARELA